MIPYQILHMRSALYRSRKHYTTERWKQTWRDMFGLKMCKPSSLDDSYVAYLRGRLVLALYDSESETHAFEKLRYNVFPTYKKAYGRLIAQGGDSLSYEVKLLASTADDSLWFDTTYPESHINLHSALQGWASDLYFDCRWFKRTALLTMSR